MSDLTVNAATRTALLALQNAADARLDAARRLESGKRVERVGDDPAAFFQARALSNRIADIDETGRRIGQALSAVETGLVGIEAAEELAQQLRGLALSARDASADRLPTITQQFDILRNQLDTLAADVSYGGVSLLSDPAGTLSVEVGDISAATADISGQAASASALGIGTASGTYNGFASSADISAAVSAIDGAVDVLRGAASRLGSGVALLNIRETFSSDLSATLQGGVDDLVLSDLDEEAARLVSARTRDQLGTFSLGVAAESETAIQQLLGIGR